MFTKYVEISTTSCNCAPALCKNVANILDHRASLHANIEPRCARGIDFGAGDRVVGTARAGSGHKQKISRPLDVRILAARRGFSFDDFALRPAHSCSVGSHHSRMQMLFNSE